MPPDDLSLDALAEAVLDGGAVDWAAAEVSVDEATGPIVRQLRLVASVAHVHRLGPPDAPPRSSFDGAPDSDHWGHLRLIERIGLGTFGEVYRAWDTRLDREVALKLTSADRSDGPHRESAVIREGRMLARVRHPNVVTIHGAERIGDRIGLWMEYVRGRTLEQVLKEGATFRAADVVHVGVELCRAVSAVHGAGLLHRDIKAHNVMRAEDGRIVLMDFGAGTELVDGAASELTGTPLYLAPEVLAGGAATVRSDIYSLGVLLYHLVTGSYPVTGRSMRDVREAHARGERIDIRRVRASVWPALARVVERACHPRPDGRYESVDALARDLLALQRYPALRVRHAIVAAAAMLAVVLLGGDPRACRTQQDNQLQRAEAVRDRRSWHAEEAVKLYLEVPTTSPEYPAALAGLAVAYGDFALHYPNAEWPHMAPGEFRQRLWRHAEDALALDPTLAEAHAAKGILHALDLRWDVAEAEFRDAIDREPDRTRLYVDHALFVLIPWGKSDEAVDLLTDRLERDPQSLDARRALGKAQLNVGLYEDAWKNFRRVLDEDAEFPLVDLYAAWALYFMGERDAALEGFEKFSYGQDGIADTDDDRLGARGYIYAIQGLREQAEAIAESPRFSSEVPQRKAEIYGLTKNKEKVLEALHALADLSRFRAASHLDRPELGLSRESREEFRRRRLTPTN